MSNWSLWLGIITLLIVLSSVPLFVFGKDRKFLVIGSALLLAFSFTYLIHHVNIFNIETFLSDFINDLWVAALLLGLYRKSKIALGIAGLYGAMWVFGYYPYASGIIPKMLHHQIVNAAAYFQLFLLIGGLVDGYVKWYRSMDGHVWQNIVVYFSGKARAFNINSWNSHDTFGTGSVGISDTEVFIHQNSGNNNHDKEYSKKVIHTPTYGNRATTFWKPL